MRRPPCIHIDFETRSAVNLRTSNVYCYAEHPSTRVLCLAYKLPGEAVRLWRPHHPLVPDEVELSLEDHIEGDPPPQDLFDVIADGVLVKAHNVTFERIIWSSVCVPRLGWPEVPFESWRCTMAKCSAAGVPASLGGAAAALGLDTQKMLEGKSLLERLSKPRKPTKNNPARWHEDRASLEKLWEYCVRDVEVEAEIDRVLPELRGDEQEVFQLDARINDRGIPVDTDLCRAAIAVDAAAREDALRELKTLTGIDSVKKRVALLAWLRDRGYPADTTAADVVDRVLERRAGELRRDVRRVLQLIREAGGVTVAKYKKALALANPDGRVQGAHRFLGTNTGRWGGRGVQFQNVKRGLTKEMEYVCEDILTRDLDLLRLLYQNPLALVGQAARGMVRAPDGKVIVAGDFSGVEVRGLAWLVMERRMLRLFAAGQDPYIDLAASVFDRPYGEIAEGRAVGEKTAIYQRDIGKRGVLGLGYGMGANYFFTYCDGQGIPISRELAEKAVHTYRTAYPAIPSFWYALEGAALRAVLDGGAVRCGKLVCQLICRRGRRWLLIRLPSGRPIAYYNPRVTKRETPWGEMKNALTFDTSHGKAVSWGPETTYGGRLVENIVQGLCRDLLSHAMIEVDKQWPIFMHVHDEVVVEANELDADPAKMEAVMCEPPEWAKDFPLNAEAWKGRRYRK